MMTKELMTAPEVAKYLKVELRTVYRYLKEAQLPTIRMEGRWRFRQAEIDQWLLRRTQLKARKRPERRILVVDDDEHSRSMLLEFLQTVGCTARGAESGEAALALLREATFDLLLVDLQLPGIDGLELIRRVRRLHPVVPIIILTGYGSKEGAIEAMRLKVTDFFEKPIQDLPRLASAVERALKP